MRQLKALRDRLLGRGEASTAVPTLDGSFKPNTLLDQAEMVGEFDAPADIAAGEEGLLLADGATVRHYADGSWKTLFAAGGPITALASFRGGVSVAVGGTEIVVVGGAYDGRRWSAAAGVSFKSVNAIAAHGDHLVASDGSLSHDANDWVHDLMNRGRTGRVISIDAREGSASVIAGGLSYAFGVLPLGDRVWVSETWRHRIRALGEKNLMILDHLPAYPCRMAPAAGGGAWLSLFARRTQLIEFVLREDAFRQRMMREIEPEHWVAPALRSGDSTREPVQAGGIRSMGVLKPWAPPRSYGLVARVDAQGIPLYSIHSRVGAENHGVVAVAENGGDLFILAKGPRRVLRLSIADIEKEVAE